MLLSAPHIRIFMRFLLLPIVLLLHACTTSTPENDTSKAAVTVADIDAGIRAYIDEVKLQEGGVFPVPFEGDTLLLKLVRVHTEYLSNLGPGRHFACVDLVDASGDVYDVDFFLEGEVGSMKVTETTVHKTNGKPLYSWQQLKDKTWTRVATEESSRRLLGVVEGEDHFTFTYSVRIPPTTGNGRLWIPIPQSDDFQTIDVLEVNTANIAPKYVNDQRFGNRIMVLDLPRAAIEREIALKYQVHRLEKPAYENVEPDVARYLEPEGMIPVGGEFTALVDSILAARNADTHLMKARALYDHIIDNLRYAKAGKYGTGDAQFACDAKSGNCTEFHSLFISMARTAGIPARFAIGAALPSERDEGGVDGYHCWAEFFADGKWWPVDISEGNKYTALATYYFGHHPANRIEFSRGRDLLPEPMPANGAIPFFAYPVFEVENKPAYVATQFSYERHRPVSGLQPN